MLKKNQNSTKNQHEKGNNIKGNSKNEIDRERKKVPQERGGRGERVS